jgi:hypothetical protein
MTEVPVEDVVKKCTQHPLKNSRKDCDICGDGMCSICIFSTGTQKVCPKCYDQLAKTNKEPRSPEKVAQDKQLLNGLALGGIVIVVICAAYALSQDKTNRPPPSSSPEQATSTAEDESEVDRIKATSAFQNLSDQGKNQVLTGLRFPLKDRHAILYAQSALLALFKEEPSLRFESDQTKIEYCRDNHYVICQTIDLFTNGTSAKNISLIGLNDSDNVNEVSVHKPWCTQKYDKEPTPEEVAAFVTSQEFDNPASQISLNKLTR